MTCEIPEGIIEETRLCLHKHGCLSSCAIFPQCMVMGEKMGDGIVVKKKSYCIGECLYRVKIAGQDINKLSLCFCPVLAEVYKRDQS
ncbi:MAG: hypothetical protein KJ990_00910 [Proteobacteria bacterium]|nr:hypothetical protein [Pseudomonadota bacterium]MBU1648858.1 hypothetical protein [Pseudomonadota bacterium]